MNNIEKVDDIDWNAWAPEQRATLLFIFQGDKVLLIHKKRGLGAGKINAVGGRLDPGETAEIAAVRETEEELCIHPVDIISCGELSFQFVDGLSIHVTVFKTYRFTGIPAETDEAKPVWFNIDDIPYDRMWADDRLWVPLMLKDIYFTGRFIFDDDKMLDMKVVQVDKKKDIV